eukprot:s3595_g1.t2
MKIQLLSLVSAAVALSLPEMPALPDLVEIVENSFHGNFTAQTVEEPKALLPTIAAIRAMTDKERGDRFHWFLCVFLLVFVCVVISGTVIMMVGAKLKALGSYHALGQTAPLSQVAQLWLVMLSFGCTVLLSSAACLWSLQTGRLSKTLGLDWEVYLLLFCCAGASLLIQAVVAVAWLKRGDRFDATAFAVAAVSSMVPPISDQWDTLKDIIFGGLCFQSQHSSIQAVGVLSWSYLLAFHFWFFWLPAADVQNDVAGANCFNELATSHLSVLLIAPKVQGEWSEWSGGCRQGIKMTILSTIFGQVTASKRHHLLIENVPQALMSLLFLAVEGGSFFVAALGVVVPVVQIALAFSLYKPVRAASIPALGKKLSRAMNSGNTVAAKALWEEAEITDDIFTLILPHLTFFLDVTKHCGFMSEELQDLDNLIGTNDLDKLGTLQCMAAVFAGQALCDLKDLKIGDSGAKVVAKALKSSTTALLSLLRNEIGYQGAEALAEGLKSNGSLLQLDLDNNNIVDRGAVALAKSLKSNDSLRELWLQNNHIGERGAEALAESLKSNRSLKELWLRNNHIGERGAEAPAAERLPVGVRG